MCGIVGFLSSAQVDSQFDLAKYLNIEQNLKAAGDGGDWDSAAKVLDDLAGRFAELMSFAVFKGVVFNAQTKDVFVSLAQTLDSCATSCAQTILSQGSTEDLSLLNEKLKDYHWQVQVELLDFAEKTLALLPGEQRGNASSLFTAWSLERVLDSLDKLEVRGRDSAGLAICLTLPNDWSIPLELASEAVRLNLGETETGRIFLGRSENGAAVLRCQHKVASLVGHLGDNGAVLRKAIAADSLLWSASEHLAGLNVLAHTRWASHGSINVANCHPVDGSLPGQAKGGELVAVINGDIDNYAALKAASVTERGLGLTPEVSTDSKILPVRMTLDTTSDAPLGMRLTEAMKACRGSLAVGIQSTVNPELMGLAQQGSGQALYVSPMKDGWLLASELYGLASAARSSYSLNTGGEEGVCLVLGAKNGETSFTAGRLTGADWSPDLEAIDIFSRDIFRGDFNYFIEKEIAEAPESVRKTLVGKVAKTEEGLAFLTAGFGGGQALKERLAAQDSIPLRRIIVIGHGTAAMAGLGVAQLLRRSLARTEIKVEACKASELFGFLSSVKMTETLVVAISQSGTTTDTNRVVDIARRRGAWIHVIVNRRNSALVQKADSYLYTSDGRDIEMSVASTKAYYSQVAAGKLLALFIGAELGVLTSSEVAAEFGALAALPAKINEVLALKPQIAKIAQHYAPQAQNWALVGNGENLVAAEEIRIKMSELCYKAIPCDVTEDKKHIDLSTEPLTLVVANALPEEVVSDTVKEVAIFKAHNGKPIVLCCENEKRFDRVAEAVIPLPEAGGGLAFVLATVAGHLFGIAVAQSIDKAARLVRQAGEELLRGVENPALWNWDQARGALQSVVSLIAAKGLDCALSAGVALKFMKYFNELSQDDNLALRLEMAGLLIAMAQDISRPIDTIRHQAKTVTVGISRPEQELSPLLGQTLHELGLAPSDLKDADRHTLEVISPLIEAVKGATLYNAEPDPSGSWLLQLEKSLGKLAGETSRYLNGAPASGTKRTVLRREALQFSTGKRNSQSLAVLPLWRSTLGRPTELLLLELGLPAQAPIPQMLAVLKNIRDKYDEMQEHLDELDSKRELAELLKEATPHDVFFMETPLFIAKYLGKP